LFKVIVLLI